MFLNDLQVADYTSAQKYLTSSGQYSLSPSDLATTFKGITKTSGSWVATKLVSQQLRTIAGIDMCNCDYQVTFDHGSISIRLVLVRDFNGWKINTMSIM
jgi:hypothetical protein